MSTKTTKTALYVLAACATLTAARPASASPLDDLKGHLKEGEKLLAEIKGVEQDFQNLSATVKAKLQAKKERMKNAASSFKLVAKALVDGRPVPVYLTKSSGPTVSCGDKIWLHNAAQDKVLRSEYGQSGKPVFVAVNLGWNGKNTLKAPNITIECRDKGAGKPLAYGDAFTLKVDPDKNRPDGRNLDDGKPYFYAGTKAGYDPVVRLGSKSEIDKWKAYWTFRGGEGGVQTGIPMELVATNRPDNANVGGFCGVGPKGVLPVVRFNMSNHCGHVEIAAAMVSEGIGRPPQWAKDLAKEVRSLAKELRKDIENAGKGSDGPKPPAPMAKPGLNKSVFGK